MHTLHRLIPALCLTLCLLLPAGTYATGRASAAEADSVGYWRSRQL